MRSNKYENWYLSSVQRKETFSLSCLHSHVDFCCKLIEPQTSTSPSLQNCRLVDLRFRNNCLQRESLVCHLFNSIFLWQPVYFALESRYAYYLHHHYLSLNMWTEDKNYQECNKKEVRLNLRVYWATHFS